MNNNYNENQKLDDFLDGENEQNQSAYPYRAGQKQPNYGYPHYEKPRKKNFAVIALLGCILVVGMAVLSIQIFHPFDKDNQNEQTPSNGGYYQNEQPNNNGNGAGDGPQFHQGEPNNEGPNTYRGGSGEAGDGPQSGELYINGQSVLFRSDNGKTEYSTDGGKTWSETPPEGMPPLP